MRLINNNRVTPIGVVHEQDDYYRVRYGPTEDYVFDDLIACKISVGAIMNMSNNFINGARRELSNQLYELLMPTLDS